VESKEVRRSLRARKSYEKSSIDKRIAAGEQKGDPLVAATEVTRIGGVIYPESVEGEETDETSFLSLEDLLEKKEYRTKAEDRQSAFPLPKARRLYVLMGGLDQRPRTLLNEKRTLSKKKGKSSKWNKNSLLFIDAGERGRAPRAKKKKKVVQRESPTQPEMGPREGRATNLLRVGRKTWRLPV